ncbi:hypothetical protein ACSBR1_040833 [Camellia fascicularis]
MQDARDWGPRPNKFINAWTLHPQFLQVVKTLWEDLVVTGWARFVIHSKMKALRAKLKEWNIHVFGNVKQKLKEAEDELHLLDLCAESRERNVTELARTRVLREEVWKWSKRQEWMWLQKSRLSWALKGDRNTKFFHIVATSRQTRNLLNSLVVECSQCDDPATIKRETFKFFATLFKNDWMLAKWWWRFGKDDKAMWKIVLCAKYGLSGGSWFPFAEESCRLSTVWGGILALVSRNSDLGNFYIANCMIIPGNGSRIRFWVDLWLGSHSLCLEFPRLYSLSVEKEVSLCNIVERKRQSDEWVFNFQRICRAWEVEELGRLCAMLNAASVDSSGAEDKLCWKPSFSGEFTVASLYNRNIVWSSLVDWWGLQWVVPGTIGGLLDWNECVFSGSQPQLDLLSDRVKVRIALWITYHHPRSEVLASLLRQIVLIGICTGIC